MIQGRPDVGPPFLVEKIIVSQEQLSDLEIEVMKVALVNVHQPSLAGCGAGLEHIRFGGALFEARQPEVAEGS